jgi:hypothetical protein
VKKDGRYFRLEAVLEAPIWVLAIVAVFVTIAVIASAVTTL